MALQSIDQLFQDASQPTQEKDTSGGLKSVDQLYQDAQGNEATSNKNIQPALNDTGDESYNGFCEQFVEQATYGKTGMYNSAIDAFNQNAQKGNAFQGTQGIKPGDLVYFSANAGNGGYGHTGIYIGNNQFVSATDSGVKTYNLNDWQSQTGQQLLGYVPV